MKKVFNKYLLLLLMFVLFFLVIEVVLKQQVERYAIHENNEKLENILINQKALHTFVETMQKPVIYKLKQEKKLYEEFFDPNLLSFTYIARNIHTIENKILLDSNRSQQYYKLASVNPRNDLNKATKFEESLIQHFNSDQNLKEYKTILEEDGKTFLYFAKPVAANKESCMRCHSTPNLAPSELVASYGDKKGFFEKVGDVRAIISMKIPLNQELKHANEYYTIISIIIFLSLAFIYIVIVYLMLTIDKKQRILEKYSKIDALTAVLNRRSFDIDMEIEIYKFTRTNTPFSLISFDIDYFKNINDTYGHQTGDRVLVELSHLVSSLKRPYDLLYRVGGEEFMIIAPHTNLEEVRLLAERLREAVQEHDFENLKIAISLGICEYRSGDSYESIYKRVDDALYRAKKSGRNRVEDCN